MSDTLGGVAVPEISTVGTYPLPTDYPFARVLEPQIAVHRFGNKTEQRFYLGSGTRRFRLTHSHLTPAKRKLLADFWTARQGAYGQFTVAIPQPEDGTTTSVTCRFADSEISFSGLLAGLSSTGVDLIEVPTGGGLTYPVNATAERIPTDALKTALLSQVQEIIPLVKIQPADSTPAMYVSDRRCTVGGQLYQPRLLKLPRVAQSIGGQADMVDFQLGNADRVLTAVAKAADLDAAEISLSLYHVGTGIKLDFWKGQVTEVAFRPRSPIFTLRASDGIYDLTLPYPERKVGRECWKPFKHSTLCPYSGGEASCAKSWADCQARGMQQYFGGITAEVQSVRTRDKSAPGGILVSSSMLSDSVYDVALQQIYCNITDADKSKGFVVNAPLVAGRDEGEFYAALGIVGAGPLGEYAEPESGITPPVVDAKPPFMLDGQPHHGWTPKGLNPRSRFGLRLGLGADPATPNEKVGAGAYLETASDKFSLGQGGEGPQSYGAERAAGVAFAEVRRSDTKGLQLSKLSEHAMQVTVRKGLSCWTWTAPGTRTLTAGCTSPVWIAVNAVLRARGVFTASAEVQEQYFDCPQAVADASICALPVPKLIGEGSETQYTFTGVIADERPLRDWLQDILNCALGYYWFAFGRLRTGLKMNSSVDEAFGEGNMLWESLDVARVNPSFNHLTGTFADAEFGFVGNSVTIYDVGHATRGGRIQYTKKTMPLVGVSTKSQAARLATTRLREELGGTTAAHRKYHSQISLRSTILALGARPGMVCSVTHEELPTYPASNDGQAQADGYCEFRVDRIELDEDYSVTISGTTTHNDIYDLTHGPKPKDVDAPPLPDEDGYPPGNWNFDADTDGDGRLFIRNLSVGSYGDTVHQGTFEIYYLDETEGEFTTLVDVIGPGDTSFEFFGAPPRQGEYIAVGSEVMLVTGVAGGTATVERAQLGTAAAAHGRVLTTVADVSESWPCELTVPTYLAIEPGMQLVGPGGDQSTIVYYEDWTGKLRTALPIPLLADGDTVYTDPRVFRLRKRTEVVTFAPRFFRSPGRASFVVEIPLAYAGVSVIRGQLENTRGLKSEYLLRGFTTGWQHRIRTLGTMAYDFSHPALPEGDTEDACMPLTAPETQPLEFAYAEYSGGDSGAVAAPRAPTQASPGGAGESGRVTFSGTVHPGLQIGVVLTGVNNLRASTFLAYEHGLTTSSTLTQLAAAVAAWLNADPEFRAFCSASSSGAAVIISDISGFGGTLACQIGGQATATAVSSGLSSPLGINSGRRYACAFTGSGFRSDLGEAGPSSGAAGGATHINLGDIPRSADGRITSVEVYAAADGTSSDWRLVATVSNGTTSLADTTTEAARGGLTAYPGPTQPSGPGSLLVTVRRDGTDWFQLYIPPGHSRSGVLEGIALHPLALGSVLTLKTINEAGPVALRVAVQ